MCGCNEESQGSSDAGTRAPREAAALAALFARISYDEDFAERFLNAAAAKNKSGVDGILLAQGVKCGLGADGVCCKFGGWRICISVEYEGGGSRA